MAYIDIDLSDFDTDDVIEYAIEIAKNNGSWKDYIVDELNLESKELTTIRDEQYDEVFKLLKESYTVQQLEDLIKNGTLKS